MRLINVNTYETQEFFGASIPPYAILSHTWDAEEVSFQDMSNLAHARKKQEFKKIEYCCQQADADGWSWAWVDTCCIDKTSSAELSEAINSMFQCDFSIMDDTKASLRELNHPVRSSSPSENQASTTDTTQASQGAGHHKNSRFVRSRWFTRGWTLQELIAPLVVQFYDTNWGCIGTKDELKDELQAFTRIPVNILDKSMDLSSVPVVSRMHWAAARQTTREEDIAYCLMGMFDVHMPLLYGEGMGAFQRLQEQIMQTQDDDSLFLWGLNPARDGIAPLEFKLAGMMAPSPRAFRCNWQRVYTPGDRTVPPRMTSRGLHVSVPIQKIKAKSLPIALQQMISGVGAHYVPYLAALDCYVYHLDRNGVVRPITPVILLFDNTFSHGSCYHRLAGFYVARPVIKRVRDWEVREIYVQEPSRDELHPQKVFMTTRPLGNLEVAESTKTAGYLYRLERFIAERYEISFMREFPRPKIMVSCCIPERGKLWFHVVDERSRFAPEWYGHEVPKGARCALRRPGTGPAFSGTWDVFAEHDRRLRLQLTLFQKEDIASVARMTLYWAIVEI